MIYDNEYINNLDENCPIRELESFPLDGVKRMLFEQLLQDNEPDISVFISASDTHKRLKGFNWNETSMGISFWCDVITKENFDLFYTKYSTEKARKAVEIKRESVFKECLKNNGLTIIKNQLILKCTVLKK